MKNILNIIGLTSLLVLTSSCEDFLERTPKTSITAVDYFKTASDLETYTNRFYQTFLKIDMTNGGGGAPFNDRGSDNLTMYTNGTTNMYTMIDNDGLTPSNVGGWNKDDWARLRLVNYMLDNIHPSQMNIAEVDLNHYVGIARYFRGDYYYKKVKDYSAVPFYNTALDDNDPGIYKASDSRELVVDSVISDLEFAAKYIKPALGQRTALNRYAALTLLARVCLYEATYRKYHTELGLAATANTFLDKAIAACEEIMNAGLFQIHGSSAEGYSELFCSEKLRDNKEIILFMECDATLGIGNNAHSVLGMYSGLTRSLMEAYQMKDGSDYSPTHPDGSYKTFVEVFQDRDPRMSEVFAYPGFNQSPDIEGYADYKVELNYGGFDQLKFYPRLTSQRKGWNMNYTSLPIFRYAEVLLIYAEAKAEKGTLTQADLDQSVNLIRNRVGMPAIVQSGNVLEDIRRERRVELACEGFRMDDIKRWALGRELLGVRPQGMYIHGYGAFDTTGDGVPDIALLPNEDDESSIANLPEDVRAKLTKRYVSSGQFTLSEGDHGYMEFVRSKNRKWEDKYYYIPIPKAQMDLNPNLIQSPGW